MTQAIRMLLVCLSAGAAAGAGTGFAGLSAATVIAPMLIAFLGVPWYEAVGIGLASDVLASAFSALIYRKNKNIDLKNGIFMLISVLVCTVAGSFFSQYMPNLQMGYISILGTAFMGIKFIVKPITESSSVMANGSEQKKKMLSILCGACIGFYCGFMGVGGGMMMLFILTCILGYELKIAVGTSVFVMTFTALTGAASHFYFGDVSPYLLPLALCSLFTTIGAFIASYFANKMSPIKTNRATGITLLLLGLCMLAETFLGV